MKPFEENDWNTKPSTETPPSKCGYVGVAIGPESHDGYVRVNGILLQAGRPLPLRANQYKVERVLSESDGTGFDSAKKLQLLLYEPGDIVPSLYPRANGRFGARLTGTGSLATALLVPAIARRKMQVVLIPDGTIQSYRVLGRWAEVESVHKDTTEYELVNETGPFTDPIVFYVGGTNEGENYHEYEIEVDADGGEFCYVYAETIGEIGCP